MRQIAFGVAAMLVLCALPFRAETRGRVGSDTLGRRDQRARELYQLTTCLRQPRAASAAASAILAFAAREPNLALRKYAVTSLLEQRSALHREQRTQLLSFAKEVFPRQAAVPVRGTIEVRHFIGDEFWRSGLAQYRSAGFEVSVHGNQAVARRGRLHVKIVKGDEQVLRDMGDPSVHVVVFSGHADVGGVMELGLRTAPAQRGDKLVVGLQCRGVQTMPLVAGRYDRAQIIATRHESYDSEDRNLLMALYNGLERGSSYKEIRAKARTTGPIDNYLFPDNPVTMSRWDLDRDGHMDFRRGRLNDRRFDVAARRASVPGTKLLSAVGFLNSTNRYYAEDTPHAKFSIGDVNDALIGGGIAARSGKNVTEIRRHQLHGQRVFEVKLNPAFARLPKESVAAAAIYEMENRMSRSILGRVTRQDKLRALLFVADYLYRIAPYIEQANSAMKFINKRYGFPPSLTYTELQTILWMDKENLGTDPQIAALERLLATKQATTARGAGRE